MHIPIGINNELHNVFTFQSTNNFLKIHSYFEFLQNINMYGVLCTKSSKSRENTCAMCKSIRMLHQKGFHPIVQGILPFMASFRKGCVIHE